MSGILDKFLNIVPCNCLYCLGQSIAISRLSDEARLVGLDVIELKCTNANKDPVWSALNAENPIFVNGFGHGNSTTYTGDSTTMIFDVNNCGILGGRIVYLLSCSTANQLGPAIIAAGGIAYGGYRVDWTWMAYNSDTDPYLDWFAEGFFRSSNTFPQTLIQGDTVSLAQNNCIAEYNRWINIWSTEKSDDPYAAEVIKWLIWDRDGLVVLGDKSARATSLRIKTTMITDISPPASIDPGVPFRFAGRLVETDTGNPLSGKTINLLVEGSKVGTTTTGANGAWTFDVSLPKGRYAVAAQFSYDSSYRGSYTPEYLVVTGYDITKLEIIKAPPVYQHFFESWIFAGILRDITTGAGIPNGTVHLYVLDTRRGPASSTELASTLTDANGNWSFNVDLTYYQWGPIYVKFKGSVLYDECSTDLYDVLCGNLLEINSTPGGNTNPPSPFWKVYSYSTVVKIIQSPYSGYLFDHWELNGVVSKKSFINVNIGPAWPTQDNNVLAVFKKKRR